MTIVCVTLSSPVDHEGGKIISLTFREAEVGDLLAAEKFETEMERMVSVLASISGTPVPVFHKIKARDLRKIMAAVSDIVGNEISPPTGSA